MCLLLREIYAKQKNVENYCTILNPVWYGKVVNTFSFYTRLLSIHKNKLFFLRIPNLNMRRFIKFT